MPESLREPWTRWRRLSRAAPATPGPLPSRGRRWSPRADEARASRRCAEPLRHTHAGRRCGWTWHADSSRRASEDRQRSVDVRRRRSPAGERSVSRRKPAHPVPRAAAPRRAAAMGLLLTLALGAGVLAWRAYRTRGVRRDPGLSVLLISIDTLRADALGCYGRKDAATPWIDRLARAGVRFETAHAHNVVTLPSHANLLSGRYPFEHGVRDNSGFRFPEDRPTLATLLQARGYRTGAFVSAFVLDARFGLGRGFDVYDDRLGGKETTTAFVMPERRGAQTVAAAKAWLDGARGAPTFAFVHIYEPHFPYAPPEPFASRFRADPYAGEVAAADAILEPLLAPLLAAGASGRTLVLLTSDHGESLGQHGERTHGVFAYEATLRVPLILYAPGLLQPGVVHAPARHVDVLPTLLDALGLPVPDDLPGRSLLPIIAGRPSETRESYFEVLGPSLDRGWAPLHGALRGGLKYIDLPIAELYDLDADAAEERNLVGSRPGDVAALRSLLDGFRSKDPGPSERVREDAAAAERLRALGYTAASSAKRRTSYGEGDDPKRLVDLDTLAADALTRYVRGDIDGAATLCRELVRRRPDMAFAHVQLAALERRRGRLDAALAALRQAVALRPLDAETASLYGVYLTEAGHAREAAAFLTPYAAEPRPDPDVLTALGAALAQSGRQEQALATFARARELAPRNAMVLVNEGTVHLMSGDREKARHAFEAALAIDSNLARAENGLGVIAASEGRRDDAIERWKRAAALDPLDYQTLFNLGATLHDLGRPAEARPYLEAYLRTAPEALEARDMAQVRAWLAGR